MEEARQRKKRFVVLLEELLAESQGVKGKLAKKLNIKPSTLTYWLQGKIDPASLDVTIFLHLAKQKNISINELALFLGISRDPEENSLQNKFKNLVEQLLANKSQQDLADRLGVNRNTVSSWIAPSRKIDPAKISIGTMAAIALEKGWTIERLFIYLGFKDLDGAEDLRFKLKSIVTTLSPVEQIDLLAWLSTLVGKTVKDPSIIVSEMKNRFDIRICVILEQEDLAIASNYSSNLVRHLEIEPENITIATIPNLPDSLEDIGVLIFDLSNADSPAIELIQDLNFDGDIVVFSAIDLSEDVREAIDLKVTDVMMKPLDWQQLKEKEYFT